MTTHAECAHAWAHHTGRQRNAGRVWYEGGTIYSYGRHFPIARHVALPDGTEAVLFTTRSYSSSTGSHKRIVLGACSHLPTFHVEHPDSMPSADDFDARIRLAAEWVAKAKRARTHGDWHLRRAADHIGHANRLREAFALDRAPASLDTLTDDMADIMARVAVARQRQAEIQAHAERVRFERQAERREAWLAGSSDHWHGTALDGTALLRVVGDTLQTSLGVSVPLAHAIRVFRFVRECRDAGRSWARTGAGPRVGYFTLDTVYADGTFHAGCHCISYAEAERVALAVGVLTAA